MLSGLDGASFAIGAGVAAVACLLLAGAVVLGLWIEERCAERRQRHEDDPHAATRGTKRWELDG